MKRAEVAACKGRHRIGTFFIVHRLDVELDNTGATGDQRMPFIVHSQPTLKSNIYPLATARIGRRVPIQLVIGLATKSTFDEFGRVWYNAFLTYLAYANLIRDE